MSLSGALQSALSGSTSLEKMEIYYEQGVPGALGMVPITVLFNPATLRFNRDVTWKIAPVTGQSTLAGYTQVTFCAANPRTLTLDLFFDSYEGDPTTLGNPGSVLQQAAAAVLPLNPFNVTPTGKDVSQWTRPVANLANVQAALHQPPMCKLQWGMFTIFYGVLTSLSEEYTMFLADGTPVRATLGCTFTEAVSSGSPSEVIELESADIYKTYVLRRGDTLSGIAQAMYNDATQWRLIAEANGIMNPRDLGSLVGTALTIPKLVG